MPHHVRSLCGLVPECAPVEGRNALTTHGNTVINSRTTPSTDMKLHLTQKYTGLADPRFCCLATLPCLGMDKVLKTRLAWAA